MNSTPANDPPENVSFVIFQVHGFLVGGLGPVFIFIVLNALGYQDSSLNLNAFGAIVILFGTCLVLAFIVLAGKLANKKSKWLDFAYLLQAILSFVLLHYLVVNTGGSKSSVFAFSYLYVPAVVAYTYNSGRNLYGASAILGYSYIKNLFGHEHEGRFLRPITDLFENISCRQGDGYSDNVLHLVVFAIQLFMVMYLAFKGRSKSR